MFSAIETELQLASVIVDTAFVAAAGATAVAMGRAREGAQRHHDECEE
jgi:hypothetical protein